MVIVPTQPQTAWQVVRSGFALWQSTFRFVGPFSIGFATINAWYDYDSINVVDHSLGAPSVFVMGMLSMWIHASIIDAMHRARANQDYHCLRGLNSLKKTAMFFLVVMVTISIILAGTLCLIIPGIILSIYLVFSPYLVIIDEGGIAQSIRNSFATIENYWWFLSNRLSIIALILFTLMLGVLFVTFGICVFFRDKIVTDVTVQIKMVTIPVLWFSNAFLYPLLHAFMLETLYDLRLRKKRFKKAEI